MSARIIVIQPECRNRTGHPYAAIKSLEHAVSPASPIFCVHRRASRSLDLARGLTVRQFDGRISIPAANERSIGEARGTRQLGDLLSALAVSPDDQLVFPSADAETVHAVLHVLRTRDTENWPHCHLRFIGDERRRDLEASAHKLLSERSGAVSRLHLYAEFDANVRHLAKYYNGNPFMLARLPTLWPDQIGSDEHPRRQHRFTVGIFGPPRRDKGKYRLGRIFGELAARASRSETPLPLRALVQNDRRPHRAIPMWVSLAAGLRTDVRFIRRLPARMSSEAFISHMRRCDVVMLPYIPDTYVIRGSGIVIDAVAHGIPIVCTSGTAMCELIASGNGLAASTDQEFAQCLATIARNADQFREAARAAANHARRWRSSSLLVVLRNLQGGD